MLFLCDLVFHFVLQPLMDAQKLDVGADEQNTTIDNNHPLYLHPFDTAELYLVYVHLIGPESYPVWSRVMYVSLMCKSKIGFINGSCTKKKT